MVKSERAALGGDDVFELDESRPAAQEMQTLLVKFDGEIKRVASVVTNVARGFLAHDQIADAIVRGDRETFANEIVDNLAQHDFNTAAINMYGIEPIFDGNDPRDGFWVGVTKDMRVAISYLASIATIEFSRADLVLAEEFAGKVAASLGIEVEPTLAAEWDATPTFVGQVGEIKAANTDQVIQSIGRGKCVVWPRAMLHGVEPAIDGKVYRVGADGLVTSPKEKELGHSR